MSPTPKTDIVSSDDVKRMVTGFYSHVLKDSQLSPIFLETAQINLDHHLPRICAFWEKLLLGMQGYSRHMMNIHRGVHAKRPLQAADFERWLTLFEYNADALFYGANASRAKRLARTIATNMRRSLDV